MSDTATLDFLRPAIASAASPAPRPRDRKPAWTADTITAEQDLRDDLGLDSLDVIELVMEAEVQFGISINDEQVEFVRTVGELARAIDAVRAAKFEAAE